MKIRFVIVPSERVNDNGRVDDVISVPRMDVMNEPLDDQINLRKLIEYCNPLSDRITSWNDLDTPRCTAWISLDGTAAGEWMWGGKDGIHDPEGFEYHDIDIKFTELGAAPVDNPGRFPLLDSPQPDRTLKDGILPCILFRRVGPDITLDEVILPRGQNCAFFSDFPLAPGKTDASISIFGLVPSEWEDGDELSISISSLTRFNNENGEVDPADGNESTAPIADIMLRNMMEDL